MQVPFWNNGELIVWDYHVIAVKNKKVYDLDYKAPCSWDEYRTVVLKYPPNYLPKQFARLYRVVSGKEFLDTFSSDRSHMIKDGVWQSPPPPWPCVIQGSNNLYDFIDMKKRFIGKVMTELEFFHYIDKKE